MTTSVRSHLPVERPEEAAISNHHHEHDDHEPLSEAVMLELAGELRRLANGLNRDLRRNAVLPVLSQLTAMRPVQDMLTRSLARMAMGEEQPEPGSEAQRTDHPGYL